MADKIKGLYRVDLQAALYLKEIITEDCQILTDMLTWFMARPLQTFVTSPRWMLRLSKGRSASRTRFQLMTKRHLRAAIVVAVGMCLLW